VVDNLESRFSFPEVDRSNIDQKVELQFEIFFEEAGQFDDLGLRNNDCILTEFRTHPENRITKLFLNSFEGSVYLIHFPLPLIMSIQMSLQEVASDFLFLILDFLLELNEAFKNRFRPRRTPRNVDIHRNHVIDPSNDRIVIVKTSGAGTNAECHYPLGSTHLIVNLAEDRSDFLINGPHYQQNISLAGRKPRQTGAESIDVVMGAGR
jgi:hypothetical protein